MRLLYRTRPSHKSRKNRSASTSTGRFCVMRSGSAPLVYLHGATDWWHAVEPFLTTLEHWHVFAPEHRGHGQSGRAPTYLLSDYARDASAFMRSVSGSPVVVIGHSLGALTAMAAAEQNPGLLRALVLLDPPMFVRDTPVDETPFKFWFEWVYNVRSASQTFEALLNHCKQPPGAPEPIPDAFAHPLASQLWGVDPFVVDVLLRERLLDVDLAASLRAVNCPTLLLYGEQSRGGAMDEDDVDFVREHVPVLESALIPGAGHVLQIDQPALTMGHIKTFLAKLA